MTPTLSPSTFTETRRKRLASQLYKFAIAAGVLAIAFWFLYFGVQSLKGGFAPDDMMNIYIGYAAGPWKLILSNLMFWNPFYRPLGSAYYAAMFSIFGLEPLPYHIGVVILLTLAIPMVFLAARRLTGHDGIALTATFLASYNVGLNSLIFSTAFVYDVLAGLFCFAALAVYLKPRRHSQPLTRRRAAAVLALYICALNSKEMAVSLPVMLLLYEAAMHPPEWRSRHSVVAWLRSAALIPLAAGALTALYIVGKSIGPDALGNAGGYQQIFTWRRFMESQTRFLNTMFEPLHQIITFSFARTLQVWGLLAYYAWRTRRPLLLVLTAWVIVTPLPVTFLEGRTGACVYIPWVGWTVIIAVAVWDVIGLLSRDRALEGRARKLDQALLACVFIWAAASVTHDFHKKYSGDWRYTGEATMHVLKQFRELDFRPQPDDRVVFVDNPLENWDLAFVAHLHWRNPKLRVALVGRTPITKEEVDRAEYLIGYKDGRFVVHRRPQGAARAG